MIVRVIDCALRRICGNRDGIIRVVVFCILRNCRNRCRIRGSVDSVRTFVEQRICHVPSLLPLGIENIRSRRQLVTVNISQITRTLSVRLRIPVQEPISDSVEGILRHDHQIADEALRRFRLALIGFSVGVRVIGKGIGIRNELPSSLQGQIVVSHGDGSAGFLIVKEPAEELPFPAVRIIANSDALCGRLSNIDLIPLGIGCRVRGTGGDSIRWRYASDIGVGITHFMRGAVSVDSNSFTL